jgi:hypothetical protein
MLVSLNSKPPASRYRYAGKTKRTYDDHNPKHTLVLKPGDVFEISYDVPADNYMLVDTAAPKIKFRLSKREAANLLKASDAVEEDMRPFKHDKSQKPKRRDQDPDAYHKLATYLINGDRTPDSQPVKAKAPKPQEPTLPTALSLSGSFPLTWQAGVGMYKGERQLFLGKWKIGAVFYDGVNSQIAVTTTLPGLKSRLGHFSNEEQAKEKLVAVAKYWLAQLTATP